MPSQKTLPSIHSSPKKKHICSTCEQGFTTSGHLSRHSRTHTGERNHKCPFPGCETRCSRQDNLQQHYRIHLSPGSRRNSVRTSRARKRSSPSILSRTHSNTESQTPQHAGTPPIKHGRVYAHHSPPPNSTPPLTQATLPPAPTFHSRISRISGRVSATPSSDTSYSSDTHPILPTLSSPELSLTVSAPLNYNYRSVPTSYDQPPSNTYGTFVNDVTPVSGSSQNSMHNAIGSSFTYSQPHPNYFNHSQQQSRAASPSTAMPSRHSLSHINNPQYSSSDGPPSPTSVSSSVHSGPPTPSYPVSYGDTHSYTHPLMAASQPAVHNGQMQSQSHSFQNAYTPNGVNIAHSPRYSPPLTLAPIQDGRYIRRLQTPRLSQSYNSPYPYHSQPLLGYSPYRHSIGLARGAWKTEAMRKGVAATSVI